MAPEKKNCWEYMGCGREPGGSEVGTLGICPAACNPKFDGFNQGVNGGRTCWLVAGTFCGGAVQGKFAEKRVSCRECGFYKQVQDEEGTTDLQTGTVNIAAHTHIGLVRKSNEDRYLIRKLSNDYVLLAVADGLGGEVAGDFAAELMRASLVGLDGITQGHELEMLSSLVIETDLAIREKAENEDALYGMGTTLVCVLLRGNSVWWVHVGDSRLYLLRETGPARMTIDQTFARFLVEEGEITPEQALTHYSRHIMDQCVGCGICEPETGEFEIMGDDVVILSTDGFHKLVPDSEIATIFKKRASLKQRLDTAVHTALESGGKDNITILAFEVNGDTLQME